MKSTIESKVAARDDLFVARRLLATKDPALIKLIPPELLDRIEREHLPDAAPVSMAAARARLHLQKCSYVMTVGARVGGARGSHTRRKGRAVPCPMTATREIDGQPFCAEHGPRGHINPYYFSAEWAALRTAALARDKHVCRYCGGKATQADHIVARSKGGADALENLAACCPVCNKIAGGTLFPSFAAKKRFIRAALRTTKMQ